MKTLRRQLVLMALVSLSFGLTGCMDWWPELGWPAGQDKTWGEINPIQGMHDSPAIKPQEEGTRYPPAETVPVSYRPVALRETDVAKFDALKNPVPVTEANLQYGKLMYETTCITCHGPKGKGNGFIVGKQKFPLPMPSLTSARVRGWTDGHIFYVITHGQGRMWSYKSQLTEMERWATVNYVRALQRAEYPEPQDVERTSD